MPEYVVEDMQTEEQVDSFEEANIIDAMTHLHQKFLDLSLGLSVRYEKVDEIHGHVYVPLPYGAKYVWEVGEVGK